VKGRERSEREGNGAEESGRERKGMERKGTRPDTRMGGPVPFTADGPPKR